MNATTALTSAAVSVPLTMTTCTTTTSSAASGLAASDMISHPVSFNAFNAASALGHLSARKDYYARYVLISLGMNSSMFANCSIFCDV